MKNILYPLKIVILFFILLTENIIPQQTTFAVITDPKIGSKNSETTFKSIIDNINKRLDIDFVIVMGNISFDGSYAKLNAANNLLEEIKIPYYVTPGLNDISLAANGGVDYLQTIGGDGFSFTFQDEIFLSISPFIPYNHYLNRINIEELRWIKEFISASGSNNLFLFSPIDPRNIQNRNDFINLFNQLRYSLIFTVDEVRYSKEAFENIQLVKLPALSEKELSYSIVNLNKDSVYIFKRLLADQSDLLVEMFERRSAEINTTSKKEIKLFSEKVRIRKIIPIKETHYAKTIAEDGIIYTASKNGTINAFDQSGNSKWNYYTGGTMFHSPAKDKDVLAAAIFESDLITLNANNGDILQIIGLSENISSPPFLIDLKHNGYDTKGVIISTIKGDIFCYELYSLELVWSQKSIRGQIISAPLQTGNMVIFLNWNGEVFALNADSGSLIWRLKLFKENKILKNLSSPITDGRNVYVSYDENFFAAVDLLQGTLRWINNSISHQHIFVLTSEGQLLVKGKENNLFLVSATDGKVIKTIPSPTGKYFPNNILVIDDYKLTGTSEGNVILLDINFNYEILYNSFNAPIVSVSQLNQSSFISLDIDGNLIFFDLIIGPENEE